MLDSNQDIYQTAKWVDRMYADYYRGIDESLDKILFSLSALSLGNEFMLQKEELYQIALDLISEGEKEDLSSPDYDSQKAIKIDHDWLMCPICQESWEKHHKHRMVRCTKCNSKLYNPTFKTTNNDNSM